MTRRLLKFLTAVSLLLCVVVAVVWVRSYSYLTMARLWASEERGFATGVSTYYGYLYVHWTTHYQHRRSPDGYGKPARKPFRDFLTERGSAYPPFGDPDVGLAGFGYRGYHAGDPPRDPWGCGFRLRLSLSGR